MVEEDHPGLSIVRQCELLSIARSSFYRTPCGESAMNLTLMRLIDERAQRGDTLTRPTITIASHQSVPVQDAGDEIVIGDQHQLSYGGNHIG